MRVRVYSQPAAAGTPETLTWVLTKDRGVRGKSYSEIADQAERLSRNPRITKARQAVIDRAADRYMGRIMNTRSFRKNGEVTRFYERYSRKTYMGNSNS